jgi:hypothetical protein
MKSCVPLISWKMILMENDSHGKWISWKMIFMENDFHGK